MIQDRTVCFVSLLLSKSLLWKTQEKNKKARGVHMSFVSYLINGISLGSIYAIIALGYTMVYGIAKMLNFAHGDVIMIGCYVVFTMMSGMGMPALPSVIAATAICTVLGVVIEKIAYKPLRKATPLAVLITAIGVSYLLQNIALLIFGADTKSFTSVVSLPALKLAGGSLVISGVTVVAVAACIIIMIALMLFIKKSKAGQAMLAVSEDKRCSTVDGSKCQWNNFFNICDRFRFSSHCRCTALLRIPDPDSVHRSNAWYQSIYRSSIWRNRFHPGSIYRRNPVRCH